MRFFAINVMLLLATSQAGYSASSAKPDAEELRAGFDRRRNAVIQSLKGRPFEPAAKLPPTQPGRLLYTREYGYTVTAFALKAFLLDEMNAVANNALRDYGCFYSSDPLLRDDADSFYWSADQLCRVMEYFGKTGSIAAGRLEPATEAVLDDLLWRYVTGNSQLDEAEARQTGTWRILNSENHHAQHFMTVWNFLHLLSKNPEYSGRTLPDGRPVAQHLAAWTEYAKEYLRQRIRKGLFVEAAARGYNAATLKGIYNFYDFAGDPQLRHLARALLDLYWVTWAQEQIDGVRGGPSSRIYPGVPSLTEKRNITGRWGRFYLDLPAEQPIGETHGAWSMLLSRYRPPLVMFDLGTDIQGRGEYEITQRSLGLAEGNAWMPPVYRVSDKPGALRYVYVTPDFIMGIAMAPALPSEAWTQISSQNRWQGVIFAGNRLARLVPETNPADGKCSVNPQWGVQRKGTMITQKLRGSLGAAEMQVWFSADGLKNRTERDGWAFVESDGAYAAVRPARGAYTWIPADQIATSKDVARGEWMRFSDDRAPAIIEVGRKANYPDFTAFQDAVLAHPPEWRGETLVYEGLDGDTFTFHADESKPPEVNGRPVNYGPAKVYDSPFVQSDWDTGVVRIQKDGRTMEIDINAPGTGGFRPIPRQGEKIIIPEAGAKEFTINKLYR